MKKIAIVFLVLLICSVAMAEEWQFKSYDCTRQGVDTSESWITPAYNSYINFRLEVTGTPPDSIALDTLKIYIDTKFSSTAGETWDNLLTLGVVKKDSTINKYIPMDSLKLGTYKIGEFLRARSIRSDTITADSLYLANPWEYRIIIGFH